MDDSTRCLLLTCRATGRHPRVPGSRPALQVVRAGAADGGRDGIRGALHQAHLRRTHGVPVRLHQHSQRPAPAEGSGGDSLRLSTASLRPHRPVALIGSSALSQVVVQMEPSESYEVAHYIPAASLPYSQPGSCYTLVRLPEDDPTAGRDKRLKAPSFE